MLVKLCLHQTLGALAITLCVREEFTRPFREKTPLPVQSFGAFLRRGESQYLSISLFFFSSHLLSSFLPSPLLNSTHTNRSVCHPVKVPSTKRRRSPTHTHLKCSRKALRACTQQSSELWENTSGLCHPSSYDIRCGIPSRIKSIFFNKTVARAWKYYNSKKKRSFW